MDVIQQIVTDNVQLSPFLMIPYLFDGRVINPLEWLGLPGTVFSFRSPSAQYRGKHILGVKMRFWTSSGVWCE